MKIEWVTTARTKNKPTHTCSDCNKEFSRKDLLIRHMKQVHQNIAEYECASCQRRYKTKFALKRHIEKTYLSKQLKCEACDESFKLESHLNRHIKKQHSELRSFKCIQCFTKFKTKLDLQKHVNRIHNVKKNDDQSHSGTELICVFCRTNFSKKSLIRFHLETVHSIQWITETRQFVNMNEFHQWKEELEKSTVCQFIKKRCDKIKRHIIHTFTCHRSGVYVPKSTKNLRRLKVQGSKKLNAFCPAEMSVRENNEDSTCILTFIKTHVGHTTTDEAELAHVYLTKEERLSIAEKIASGMSCGDILSDCLNGGSDKLRLLDYHDLHNIAASYKLKLTRHEQALKNDTKPHSDRSSGFVTGGSCQIGDENLINDFVSKYANSILFYKKEHRMDDTFTCLGLNDVMLVIMSPNQRTMLQKFGNNVIALDGCCSIEYHNFFLQTILVIDNYSESSVCAFAISNCYNDDMVKVFLKCVKNNVGILHPKCLMTDTRDIYYEYWSQIMSSCRHRLFCTWYVHREWKKHLKTISNKEKYNLVMNKLNDFSIEPEENEFISKLNMFFDLEDENTKRFFNYFRTNFMVNIRSWAHCFQLNVDSNINAYMESLRNVLKHMHGKGKKIKKLPDALSIFEKYLQQKERMLRIKEIRGRLSSKLRILRKRHDSMLEKYKDFSSSIERNESGNWIVYTLVPSDGKAVVQLFSVQCINEIQCPVHHNCKLMCEQCEVCAHQYKCSCPDSSMKNNMCQHVHAVCWNLKTSTCNQSDTPQTSNAITHIAAEFPICSVDFDSSHISIPSETDMDNFFSDYDAELLDLKDDTFFSTVFNDRICSPAYEKNVDCDMKFKESLLSPIALLDTAHTGDGTNFI